MDVDGRFLHSLDLYYMFLWLYVLDVHFYMLNVGTLTCGFIANGFILSGF